MRCYCVTHFVKEHRLGRSPSDEKVSSMISVRQQYSSKVR